MQGLSYFILVGLTSIGSVLLGAPLAQTGRLVSPNGKLQLSFDLSTQGPEVGQPVFAISFRDKVVLKESAVGFDLKDSPVFKNFVIASTSKRSVDSTYTVPVGKNKSIRDHFEEKTFELVERLSPKRQMTITFRVYDDGVAFRYTLPQQTSISDFAISRERTSFEFDHDPKVFAVELPFGSSFEGFYTQKNLHEYQPEKTMTLPILVQSEAGPFVAISEAGLTDYAGQYLTHTQGGRLETRLAPSIKDPVVKVVGKTPFSTPWRVVMIAEAAEDLLNSNLINNLNEPSRLGDVSWIHPGKVVFPWWNGYRLPADSTDLDPTHKPGLNTFSLKRYIDFCAANGIDYFSLDGYDQAWYGGDIGNPPSNADVTKAIPQIDLPEVLGYARKKGIRARVWMHQAALAQGPELDKVFALYQQWGIEGIMVDFLNRDDQEMVQFYTQVIKLTAKHHLSVNFHGVWKPTGVTRTYPNLLSQEGVRSSEYNRSSSLGSPPEHEILYAFIRQLAGPLDVHPGSFEPIAPEEWSMESFPLHAMGTLARQLAVYVVMESGMQMVSDAPAAYLAHPDLFNFVQHVPVAWDESKVLSTQIGHEISIARRQGQNWYIGSMTDRSARRVQIPLGFLGKGKYTAHLYLDGADTRHQPQSVVTQTKTVSRGDILSLSLAASGGAAIEITPLP